MSGASGMTENEARWVRRHAWTGALQRAARRAPRQWAGCGCQRELTEECSKSGARRHAACGAGAARRVWETVVRTSSGEVARFAEPFEHGTWNGAAHPKVADAMVWLADRTCVELCSCSCHRSAVPGRPETKPGETLDLFGHCGGEPRPTSSSRGQGKPKRLGPALGPGAFGWLTLPDGARRLCETKEFWARGGRVQATLIALDDGSTIFVSGDDELAWEAVKPAAACALVGIPAPEYETFKDFSRRLDPFHVERHTSATWRALLDVIAERRLLSRYGLWALVRARDVDDLVGVNDEDAEQFAAAVCARLARGQELVDAVAKELRADADLDDDARWSSVLEDSGWATALGELRQRVDETQTAVGKQGAPAC